MSIEIVGMLDTFPEVIWKHGKKEGKNAHIVQGLGKKSILFNFNVLPFINSKLENDVGLLGSDVIEMCNIKRSSPLLLEAA